MFFYLIFNSTIIKHNLDIKSKIIQTLLYGSIAYIIIHATLFIGGENALLYNFKTYFWLFFLLDIIVLVLLLQSKYNFNIEKILKNVQQIFTKEEKTITQKNIDYGVQKKETSSIKPTLKTKTKKVKFSLPKKKIEYNYDSDSASDSDSDSEAESEMNTDLDIDFKQFKQSLDFSD